MKKQIVMGSAIALSLASVNSFGQSGWQTTSPTGVLYTNGNTSNVGIGTSTISDKLTVNGHIGFTLKTIAQGDNRINGRSENGLVLFGNTDWSNSSGIVSHGINNGGDIKLITSGPSGTTDALSVENFDGTNFDQRFVVKKNGYVGVGVSTPLDKFSVDGDIGFKTSSSIRSIRGRTDNYFELYSNYNADPADPNSCGPGLFMFSNKHNNTLGTPGSFMMWSTGASGSSVGWKFVHHPASSTYNTALAVNNDGSMGVGTDADNTNNYRLTVKGNIKLQPQWGNPADIRSISTGSATSRLGLFGGDGTTDAAYILVNGENSVDKGRITFVANNDASGTNGNDKAFDFVTYDGNNQWTSRMIMDKNGRIGLGTDPGVEKLYIDGDIAFKWSPTGSVYRTLRGNSNGHGLAIYGSGDWKDGGSILLNGSGSSFKGSISFVAPKSATSGVNDNAFEFLTADDQSGNWNSNMVAIRKNGKVVIGDVSSNTTTDYKLYVQTGILTEKVKVAISTTSDWSDYVFADNYELKPLSEVEEFINENNHLPEVPSAENIVKDGIDLGKMDAKLLQKIEELTLYVIQQQKEIDALKKELKK